ncbi:MAG: metallophosphoesterase [Pigmentiphaga sp.]
MRRFTFLLRLPVVLFGAYAYVAWRLAGAAPAADWRAVALLGLLALYVLILAGLYTRRSRGGRMLDALSWAGFLSLGLFSWLFVLTLLRDVLWLALWVLAVISAQITAPAAGGTFAAASALIVVVLSLAAALVGLFNARRLARVVDVALPVPGLPESLRNFTLVQISDVHVGPTIKRGYVDAIVDAVNALSPDAIALTGDIVDGNVDGLGAHTAPLGRLRARHGVYLVTGNHEYYSGVGQWVAEFRRLGLTVLLNQHEALQCGDATLVVAGVTDYSAKAFVPAHASDPRAALEGAPAQAAFKILLAHQPRSAPAAEAAGFDLQLSGHTHGGQFWPWNFFVPLQQPFVTGLHRHGRLWVYVNRGTGYWGPPLRLGSPSEITRLRLVPA